jgi:Ca2+-binding RTX toxin-like protein
VSGRQVACTGVQRGSFNMGDADDYVLASGPIPYTVNGGEGADSLSAYYASSSTLNGDGGNDSLFGSDQGGSVGDQLTGGPGRDELQGNNGKDVFHTRDGEKDAIKCGSDKVKDDPSDRDSIDTRTNCP